MKNIFNKQAKVTDFITPMKQFNIANINNILPEHITNKVKAMHISIVNVEDTLTCKFKMREEYFVKERPGKTMVLSFPF